MNDGLKKTNVSNAGWLQSVYFIPFSIQIQLINSISIQEIGLNGLIYGLNGMGMNKQLSRSQLSVCLVCLFAD